MPNPHSRRRAVAEVSQWLRVSLSARVQGQEVTRCNPPVRHFLRKGMHFEWVRPGWRSECFWAAQRGYAHPGEFGQIIPAQTRALYSWDEGGSFVHAWSPYIW